MSKVKGEIFDIQKTKLRHNLRRVESKKKERIRRKNYDSNVYGYGTGYFVDTYKRIGIYNIELVPEQKVDMVNTYWTNEIFHNIDGTTYTKPIFHREVIGTKIIPAHYKRRLIRYEYDDNYNVLKKCNSKIKPYRKEAERIVRSKLKNLDIFVSKGSSYKKLAEVQWTRW